MILKRLLAGALTLLLAVLPAATPAPAMLTVTELVGGGAGGSACGGNDANTVLLLHGDGADASTTIANSSASANALTAARDAQIDTAQSVFGGASILLDGNDYITMTDSAVFDFGSGDFTIEMRIRVASGGSVFIGDIPGTTGVGSWVFFRGASGTALSFVYNNNVTIQNSWTPSANTWYDIAVARSGTNLRMFVNGAQIGTTQTLSATINTGSRTWYIGAFTDTDAAALFHNGWIDELRVSNIARYTANYTSSTCAFSYLLRRDLDPAGNDNEPLWTRKVA